MVSSSFFLEFLFLNFLFFRCGGFFLSFSSPPRTKSSRFLIAQWAEVSSSITIPANPYRVYDLYSRLEEHPTWSPWLDEVVYDSKSGLSSWTLRTLGLTYSWKSNNTINSRPSCIQWESISGFQNRGRVEILEQEAGMTKLTLTISFDVPQVAASIINSIGSVQKFAEESLVGDLRRFKSRLMQEIRAERLKSRIESES